MGIKIYSLLLFHCVTIILNLNIPFFKSKIGTKLLPYDILILSCRNKFTVHCGVAFKASSYNINLSVGEASSSVENRAYIIRDESIEREAGGFPSSPRLA